VHKSFSPLFNPKAPDEWKAVVRESLHRSLDHVATQLSAKPFLVGDTFTVADAYLFSTLRWAPLVQIDLARWPALTAYVERTAARPNVRAALEAEGLIKK
jgi:glutathione S-transferase